MFSGVIIDLVGVQKDLIHHGCCLRLIVGGRI